MVDDFESIPKDLVDIREDICPVSLPFPVPSKVSIVLSKSGSLQLLQIQLVSSLLTRTVSTSG